MDDSEEKEKLNKASIATSFGLMKEGETSYEAVVMGLVEVFGESSRGLSRSIHRKYGGRQIPMT